MPLLFFWLVWWRSRLYVKSAHESYDEGLP